MTIRRVTAEERLTTSFPLAGVRLRVLAAQCRPDRAEFRDYLPYNAGQPDAGRRGGRHHAGRRHGHPDAAEPARGGAADGRCRRGGDPPAGPPAGARPDAAAPTPRRDARRGAPAQRAVPVPAQLLRAVRLRRAARPRTGSPSPRPTWARCSGSTCPARWSGNGSPPATRLARVHRALPRRNDTASRSSPTTGRSACATGTTTG